MCTQNSANKKWNKASLIRIMKSKHNAFQVEHLKVWGVIVRLELFVWGKSLDTKLLEQQMSV